MNQWWRWVGGLWLSPQGCYINANSPGRSVLSNRTDRFFGFWRSSVLRKPVPIGSSKNMEPTKFGIGSFGSVPGRTEKPNSTQNPCNSMFNSKFWQHFSMIAHKTTVTNITVKQSNKYINRVLTSKARHQHSARVQDTKTAHYYTIFGSSVSSVNQGGDRFYRTNFGSSEMRTEQVTETSVLGKFGSVLGFFGSVFSSR